MISGFGIRDSGFDRSRSRFANPESRIPSPVRLLLHWRKLFWLGVTVAVMMAGDVLLTTYGPFIRAATVETGASFSVSAGSFATESKAATFAAALDASGLPSLVRARPDDGRYQVLVGPYVSTDEAERAQRKLAAWGLGEARLVIDDTMRARPQQASVFGLGDAASNNIVMVAAAGMSSIVFEMRQAPKAIEARRTGTTTFDVEIGSAQPAAGGGQALSLPDGVVLVREMSVLSDEAGSMRAHLVMRDGVESRLRLEGRRVYVDLAFPKAPWHVRRPASGGRVLLDPPAPQATSRVPPLSPDTYGDQLNAVVARFTQIEPFLLSAVDSPEPDVLAALSHSMDGVRESIQGLTAPPELEPTRQSMLSAVARASTALAPAFAGDRAAAVREAVALFDASSK